MGSFMVSDDSVPCVAVSSALGLGQLRTVLDLQLGGQAPCHLVWQAAQTVARGDAEVVVVYRALNGRSGARVGSMRFAGMGGQYRYPIGYGAYLMYVGMWAQRFLHETGQGAEDLGAVAVGQRVYAQDNERALRREPLALDEYLAEPFVVDPYRRSDCTVEVDGACAVVVTSLERARDLAHPPVVVASGCYRAGPRPGLDIGDHLLWEDYTRNYTSWLRDDLFGRAGIGPGRRGRGRDLRLLHQHGADGSRGPGPLRARGVRGVRALRGLRARRALPTNTGGGLLAEGYLHGMNTVAEAVLQVQGRGGTRQAPRHEVAVVTSGALMDGSAMILTIRSGTVQQAREIGGGCATCWRTWSPTPSAPTPTGARDAGTGPRCRVASPPSRRPRRPERLAVVDRDGAPSTAMPSWRRDARPFAAWLERAGVGAGDVVSIQLPNWYEFVVLAAGHPSGGAVINPLLPVYRRKELLHVFTVAEPKVVCTPAHYRNTTI
jgi:hypothetical protein